MTKIFLLLSFTICLKTYGQTPSYEAVLTYMHENIQVNPVQGNFEIQKKPEGYFICTNFYEDGKVKTVDCQRIWNSATNEFIKPTYDNVMYFENDFNSMSERFSYLWSRRNYVAPLIYYGYLGWIRDTKQLLENKTSLNSNELETLARTYSDEANDYIHPGQYGFGGSEEKQFEDAGYSKISALRVNGYKNAYDKCMQTWEKLKKKDPNYSPNIITDLDLKLNNDYMHGYFTLTCIHEPELANEYLQKASYSSSLSLYAQTLLDECEKDGILFTNGDNDTYPLWYVQVKLGYRKDVTVINLSLAQTSWYLEFLMDQYQLKSSFSVQEVRDNHSKYFVFRNDKKISFSNWLDSFQETQKNTNAETVDNNTSVWVDGTWEIKLGSNSISINRDEQYAFAYQVFLYDVIASNPNRRIYGTSILGSFMELGLKQYCIFYGYLTRLETSQQSQYFTIESEQKIIDEIKNIPPTYFSGFGNWLSDQRTENLRRVQMISIDYAGEIVPIVEKKILSDLGNTKVNPSLASSISDFYGKFNLTKQKEYKSEFDTTAIAQVNEFIVSPKTLYDDLELFYDVISIYTSMSKYEIINYGERDVHWEGSNSLYFALTKRLEEIYENCKNDNLEASANSVSTLLSILNACDIQ